MFCIFVRHQWSNSGNPFKVRCLDLANRKQDIFGMKTTFIFRLAEKAVTHNDSIEKFFLDLPATIQLGKM